MAHPHVPSLLRPALAALALAALTLAGCGGGDGPAVERVRPDEVAPGGLVMVSGRALDRVAAVSIGGRPATSVTAVNATLLTAVAPADLPAGAHELTLMAHDGRRTIAAVRVGGAGGAAPVAGVGPSPPPAPVAQPPAPPMAPAPAPAPVAAPPRPAPPPPAPVTQRDDKDDKKKDEQKGPDRGRGR